MGEGIDGCECCAWWRYTHTHLLSSSSVARMEVSMTLLLTEILVFLMTPISGPTSSPLLRSHGE